MQGKKVKKSVQKTIPVPKAPLKKPISLAKNINNMKMESIPTNKPLIMKNTHKKVEKISKIRLLNDTQDNKEKKVVAVIVTFCSGSSYDQLFQTEEQKSLEGTKVEVYACESNYLPSLMQAFEGKPKDQIAERLLASIKEVENDCVVFNWECCSGYSNEVFHEKGSVLFSFLKKMIDRGYMCMFSDFSLKALVNEWRQKYELGPNPFVKTGEYSGLFEIRFDCSQLKECPSAQLQIIGDMAEQGHCKVNSLQSTIKYCVDHDKTKHDIYKLQVLTVIPGLKPPRPNYVSKVGQFEGSAGHVLLRYPSGGMILTSMGHWIELMKIDTSENKLFQVAEQEFGTVQATKMRDQYFKMDPNSQKQYVSSKAREFVRNQAPCLNMNKKRKKMGLF